MIRKAKISDIKTIQKMLANQAKKGDLLPRSLSELYDFIRDIFVNEEDGIITGTCSLHICWEDIAEIRSLVVGGKYRHKGIGGELVRACIAEALTLGIYKIFVLTYVDNFFSAYGFMEIDKAFLPQKIWSDCLKCVKFPDCDEIAMLLEL